MGGEGGARIGCEKVDAIWREALSSEVDGGRVMGMGRREMNQSCMNLWEFWKLLMLLSNINNLDSGATWTRPEEQWMNIRHPVLLSLKQLR